MLVIWGGGMGGKFLNIQLQCLQSDRNPSIDSTSKKDILLLWKFVGNALDHLKPVIDWTDMFLNFK